VARLLHRGEFYDSISPGALFEDDYERLLIANRLELYPAWHLVKFKQIVESEYGSARADLALIDKRYRGWWVVEVERGSHSLSGHVEPQVRSLATGQYTTAHADALHRELPTLNARALTELVRGEQPRVLVLVNEPRPEWKADLARWKAKVGVVEIFRSHRDVDVLRVNGDHPDDLGDVITYCKLDPLLPTALLVSSPAAIGVRNGERVELLYNGGLTEWKRIDSADSAWLMPTRRAPLPEEPSNYLIMEDESGKLILRATDNR
jgi:hypothetical protein